MMVYGFPDSKVAEEARLVSKEIFGCFSCFRSETKVNQQ